MLLWNINVLYVLFTVFCYHLLNILLINFNSRPNSLFYCSYSLKTAFISQKFHHIFATIKKQEQLFQCNAFVKKIILITFALFNNLQLKRAWTVKVLVLKHVWIIKNPDCLKIVQFQVFIVCNFFLIIVVHAGYV